MISCTPHQCTCFWSDFQRCTVCLCHLLLDVAAVPHRFGKMNMPPHGFSIEKFISDEATDAHCLILRRGPRVVVAFRGSSSRKYVWWVLWLGCNLGWSSPFRAHTCVGLQQPSHHLTIIPTATATATSHGYVHSSRNAKTDMTFQRGYADFQADARRGLDVIASIPGIRNLLPLVHQVRACVCAFTPRCLWWIGSSRSVASIASPPLPPHVPFVFTSTPVSLWVSVCVRVCPCVRVSVYLCAVVCRGSGFATRRCGRVCGTKSWPP